MNRRTFLGGIALAASSRGALSAETTEAIKVGSGEERIVWTRYAAKRAGRRPSVILLHGTRGFELKPSAYERYANALTAEGIDAYFVHFYTTTDSEKMKAFSIKADREAYDIERYVAWTKRVSTAITEILEGSDSSDRLGLLGFSLGGFVAAATAARDSRVAALAVLYGGMPGKIAPQVKHMPPMIELHGSDDRNVPLAAGEALVALTKAVGAPAEQVTYPRQRSRLRFHR
jgi:carboxymethylenebutenolidase